MPTLQSLLLGYRQCCCLTCWVVQPAGSVMLNFLLKYLVWVGPTASAWVCCRSVYRWIPHTVVAGEALEKGSAHRTQPRGAAQGSRLLPPVSGSMKCPMWHVTPSPGPVSLVFSLSQPRGRVRRSLGHHRGGEGRTTSRPPNGRGLFFPPLPSCLTPQCL